ncbi:hypothetical protein EC973_008288 [Apophysomyces ossiformis]|uniref:Uncharacterized protein n=1 Tax=Apophysomyces ossiformis TaxID=679940 RepID=A0A8H7EUC1_9FUNG|nr:hypothetical protein EC973_008288 [Apophysomyces ossiformis]
MPSEEDRVQGVYPSELLPPWMWRAFELLEQHAVIGLPITSQLLLGISKVLQQQCRFVYGKDVLHLWAKLRIDLLREVSLTIDMTDPRARSKAITLSDSEFLIDQTSMTFGKRQFSLNDCLDWPALPNVNVDMLFELQEDEKMMIDGRELIQQEEHGSQEPSLADQQEEIMIPDVDTGWSYDDVSLPLGHSPVAIPSSEQCPLQATPAPEINNDSHEFADALDWVSSPSPPEHYQSHVLHQNLSVAVVDSHPSTPTEDLSLIVESSQSPLASTIPMSRCRKLMDENTITLPYTFYLDTTKITRQPTESNIVGLSYANINKDYMRNNSNQTLIIRKQKANRNWKQISQWLRRMCVQGRMFIFEYFHKVHIEHSHPLLSILAHDRRAQHGHILQKIPEQARSDMDQGAADDGFDYDFGGFDAWQDTARFVGHAFNARGTSRFSSSFGEKINSTDMNKDNDHAIEPFGER